MYPSDCWVGYWEQQIWGRQPMHGLELHFAEGQVRGSGRDVIGAFTFQGQYDEQGAIVMIKHYLGRHTVLYRGQYDGEGTIFGRWSIGEMVTGPFALTLPREALAAAASEHEIREL